MITNKKQMYQLLASGALGNTLQQYFTINQWLPDSQKFSWWGIRSLVPNGTFHAHISTHDVPYICSLIGDGKYNISPMIDPILNVTAWMNVHLSPSWAVSIMENPPKGGNWSKLMPSHAIDHHGINAMLLLRKHLNANSLDDLFILLDKYPDHVVEMSACDICIGNIPHRNAITWEVRKY